MIITIIWYHWSDLCLFLFLSIPPASVNSWDFSMNDVIWAKIKQNIFRWASQLIKASNWVICLFISQLMVDVQRYLYIERHELISNDLFELWTVLFVYLLILFFVRKNDVKNLPLYSLQFPWITRVLDISLNIMMIIITIA